MHGNIAKKASFSLMCQTGVKVHLPGGQYPEAHRIALEQLKNFDVF